MRGTLPKAYRPAVKGAIDWLAALNASLSEICIFNGTVVIPKPPSTDVKRQFSSLPQFTSSGGGPRFTAGVWPSVASRILAAEQTSGARSTEADEDRWSDPDERARSLLDQVQQAALSHVGTHGWTHAALVAGAQEIGVSPAICGSLPNGATSLVQYFVKQCNQQLASKAASSAETLQALPLKQKLHTLLRWRLQLVKPYLDSWPSAMALLAHPSAAAASLQLLNEMVDEVWHAAGDTSSDLSWYAKRAALCGVYTATELYMLTDFSSDTCDTWSALDRQLTVMLAISSRSPISII